MSVIVSEEVCQCIRFHSSFMYGCVCWCAVGTTHILFPLFRLHPPTSCGGLTANHLPPSFWENFPFSVVIIHVSHIIPDTRLHPFHPLFHLLFVLSVTVNGWPRVRKLPSTIITLTARCLTAPPLTHLFPHGFCLTSTSTSLLFSASVTYIFPSYFALTPHSHRWL